MRVDGFEQSSERLLRARASFVSSTSTELRREYVLLDAYFSWNRDGSPSACAYSRRKRPRQ
jgi:hypothetical protein